tara:strand:+ start:2329 stop:2640 length:312 start_codon:yes stop_codon:yes gene_type:complete
MFNQIEKDLIFYLKLNPIRLKQKIERKNQIIQLIKKLCYMKNLSINALSITYFENLFKNYNMVFSNSFKCITYKILNSKDFIKIKKFYYLKEKLNKQSTELFN